MNILKKYNKTKKINNLTIIWISLVLALWINFLIFGNSNFQNNLKSNILESEKNQNISDIFLEKNQNDITLKTSKDINNVDSLSLSLIYNPENVSITEIIPKLNAEIIKTWEDNWITNIILNYAENYNIKKQDKILTIKLKKKEEKTENINIINSNFTDKSWETFELTNKWITF